MKEAEYIVHFQEGMEHHKAQWYDRRMTTVQELVRCNDCKHRETYECPVHVGCSVDGYDEPDDWFCADGERKE